MDLRRAHEEVKSLPDQELQREMSNPSGFIPGYLVAAELNERNVMRREKYAAGGYVQGKGIVAQVNPFYTYLMGLKSLRDLEPKTSGLSAPGPASAPLAPQSLSELVPLPPGTPKPPGPMQKYARGGPVNVSEIEQYIRQAAAARGINPDTAVRVARSEGLSPGVWQSNYKKNGIREPSYGPFQLLVGGEGTGFPAGMGNDFMRQTGLDPRDPSTVKPQIDFALNRAAKGGWTPWYGAKNSGIGRWQGINNASTVPVARNIAPQSVPQQMPQQVPLPNQAQRVPQATQIAQNIPPPIAQGIGSFSPVASQAAGAAQSLQSMQAMQAAQAASAASAASQAAQAAAAPKSPLGGLASLAMMMASKPPPPPPPVGGGMVRAKQNIDPVKETISTSQTPNAYYRRKRRRPIRIA